VECESDSALAIRFSPALALLLRVLGLGPNRSYVEIDGDRVGVRELWVSLEDPEGCRKRIE